MNHKELAAWKEGIKLVVEVYNITKTLPDSEKFGMISQMRRAAVSIPSNIAEGSGRNSDKELIQYLYISLGSLEELETLAIIGSKLNYLNKSNMGEIQSSIKQTRKLLIGLIKYLKNK